jgi:hypothetical protein
MFTKFAVAAIVVASTTMAMAQRGRGPGGFGGGMFAIDAVTLLAAAPVQKELDLSEDQKTSVAKLATDSQQARRDLFQSGAAPEEMQTKMADLTKANRKKADEILLAPQRERLDEIVIQVAGAGALTRPEVIEKLTITDEQKKKLNDLATATQDKIRELNAGGFTQDPEEQKARAEKMTKINADQKEQAVAILTADQKTKFEKMQGKKFEIDMTQLFPRRGGRRGAGGPGAGA